MYIVLNQTAEVIAIIFAGLGFLPDVMSMDELLHLGVKPEQVTME